MTEAANDNILSREQEELKKSIQDDEIEENIAELQLNYEKDLIDLPFVLAHIEKLKKIIRKQQKKLNKFYSKLKDHRLRPIVSTTDVSIQTDLQENNRKENGFVQPSNDEGQLTEWGSGANITEEVKLVAEQAMNLSGFVYEPTSRMYYDYKTGYYYNAELRMYYDGNSGRYLIYDQDTKQYTYQGDKSGSSIVTEPSKIDAINTKKRKREAELVEEGELSDSSKSDVETEATIPDIEPHVDPDVCNRWPPCLRLMVTESSVPGIPVGRLFLVTCEGGEIGRDEGLAVPLIEPAVSKVQLKISYSDDAYRIVDLGSRNGTFRNGKRISAALQESDPVELQHGDLLKIGSTLLAVHVHEGIETCNSCEPGLLIRPEPQPPLPASLPIRELKKKLGVNKTGKSGMLPKNYIDRAELRRGRVGSSHPAEKTETACVERAIGSGNKGFKMLEKMGWTNGQKLGINELGLDVPVPIVGNIGSVGLGASSTATGIIGAETKASRNKRHVLKTTRTRYEHSPVKPPDDDDDDDDDDNDGDDNNCN